MQSLGVTAREGVNFRPSVSQQDHAGDPPAAEEAKGSRALSQSLHSAVGLTAQPHQLSGRLDCCLSAL